MNKKNRTKICLFLSALVLAAILVCQFTPYWTYPTEEGEASASISNYIWFPTENKAVDSYITGNVSAGYHINQLVVPVILVLLLSAAGLVLCLFKHTNAWTALLPLGCGLAGLYGFLCQEAFKLGTAWSLHVLLYAAAAILGALALYFAHRKEKAA